MLRIVINNVNNLVILNTDENTLKYIDGVCSSYGVKRKDSIIHAQSITLLAILKEISEDIDIII